MAMSALKVAVSALEMAVSALKVAVSALKVAEYIIIKQSITQNIKTMKQIYPYILSFLNRLVPPSGVRGFLVVLLFWGCETIEQLNLVFTGKAAEPTDRSVQVEGVITDFKNAIIQHGHCWSTSPQPTVNDFKTELGTKESTGTFVSLLSDLEPNTLYFIRAYIITAKEITYSEQISVQTKEEQIGIKDFQAITEGLSNIKTTSATAKGRLSTEVNISLTQHGHIWDTQANPTLTANKGTTSLGALTINNARDYNSGITSLLPATQYYYRAYAVESDGTIHYGTIRTFNTPN
jgi:hypothetical protein